MNTPASIEYWNTWNPMGDPHALFGGMRWNFVYKIKIPTIDDSHLYWLDITKNATHYIAKRLQLTVDEHRIDSDPINLRGIDTTGKVKKMIVIRNPLDRIISSYQEMLKLRGDLPLAFQPPESFKHTATVTKEMEFYKLRDHTLKSFAVFLKELQVYGFYDIHVWPQVEFMRTKCTISDIDYVLDFENLQNDLEMVCEKNNIPLLPHEKVAKEEINVGNSEVKEELREFINKHKVIQDIIESLYPNDTNLYRTLS